MHSNGGGGEQVRVHASCNNCGGCRYWMRSVFEFHDGNIYQRRGGIQRCQLHLLRSLVRIT